MKVVGAVALAAAWACNAGTPLGPPAQLQKVGGDAQSWYFNNPLPNAFTVSVIDANDRALPGISVSWSVITGGGSLTPNPSITNSKGIATTVYTVGTASLSVISASVSGLPPLTYTVNASAPPSAPSVGVKDNFFDPDTTVVQVNDSVTWTWAGVNNHNVTFSTTVHSPDQTSGTYSRRFTTTGTFTYSCTLHQGMNGTVIVVN